MTKTPRSVLSLAALLLLTPACSARPTTAPPTDTAPAATAGSALPGGTIPRGTRSGGTSPAGAASGLSTVLLLGDSIAAGEALPLAAAFAASNITFQSLAADGGGNVVGPNAAEQWKDLAGKITSARPSVVVYQITTFDWGTRQEQQAAYRILLSTVTGVGAKLVLVTVPPVKPDDFYQPHLADLNRTSSVARAVAEDSSGQASVLDAGAVWGSTFQQYRDGKADRSTDGTHFCPQGAARFARWLLGGLAKLFPGFTPPDPKDWANTGWSADKHFTLVKGC